MSDGQTVQVKVLKEVTVQQLEGGGWRVEMEGPDGCDAVVKIAASAAQANQLVQQSLGLGRKRRSDAGKSKKKEAAQ